jgi:branched-chain amino acid transport system substrate-binding protein
MYGLPEVFLPTDQPSTTMNVQPIAAARADSYVLAALPPSASSLVYSLVAIGLLKDPKRYYLSPTLHTPVLLQTIPSGALDGARGVARGTAPEAAAFREAYRARWQDDPFDDAYAFYDAGTIGALALAHAAARGGTIPTGTGLAAHVHAVTQAGGTPVRWNEIPRALDLLGQGQEVQYLGLTGSFEFDAAGSTPIASTQWWTITAGGFVEIPAMSNCL